VNEEQVKLAETDEARYVTGLEFTADAGSTTR
jgi:hypothetical protein